jgi:predicted metal-dependent hydrolase
MPVSLAFRAMVHHRLGNAQAAKELLAEAKKVAEDTGTAAADSKILAEAEAVLSSQSPPTQSPAGIATSRGP